MFSDVGASTNFTFLSNVVNGNNASCPPAGCTTATGCSVGPSTSGHYNQSIEVRSPGGTLNNNEMKNSLGDALITGSIDGSSIGAVTGWHSLSSTTSQQALKLLNNDPNWTSQQIESNGRDGVVLEYSTVGNFGGAFSFNDLRSENNSRYGFEWITSVAPKSGTTLSWGTANAACLTGNTLGPIGSLPSGFYGPSSTSTCP